jgi:flavin-binding protein dodecin
VSHNIFKHLEIVGTSEKSIESAISNALAKAHETLRNIEWFEVIQTRGKINAGKIEEFQVILKIGMLLE